MAQVVVSVVVPTYNRAPLVERAVRSVLRQTFTDLEVIVVDDGSTDDTEGVVQALAQADSRVRHIRLEKNQGPQVARNTGILAAKGRYIALLDSDDKWLPEMLEQQLIVFQKGGPELGVVYAHVGVLETNGSVRTTIAPRLRGNIYKTVLTTCSLVPNSALMVKRECFDKCGLFDTRLCSWQDDDICIRLSKEYEFDFVPRPLVIMHHDADSQITKDAARLAQGLWDLLSIHGQEISRQCGEQVLSRHYVQSGELFLKAQKLDSARRAFLKALSIYPYSGFTLIYGMTSKLVPSALPLTFTLKPYIVRVFHPVLRFVRGLKRTL